MELVIGGQNQDLDGHIPTRPTILDIRNFGEILSFNFV